MSATNYNNFVHFTPKSLLFTILFIAVLTAPIWWPRRGQGATKAKPDLSGEWVGKAHIKSYVEGIGRTTPLDKQGMFYFKLDMYDGFLERYRGKGELKIPGESPREIDITGLSLGDWFKPEQARAAGGGLRLEANLGGDLEKNRPGDDVRVIQGSASSDRIRFDTVSDELGYHFDVDLHRGTLAEWQASSNR